MGRPGGWVGSHGFSHPPKDLYKKTGFKIHCESQVDAKKQLTPLVILKEIVRYSSKIKEFILLLPTPTISTSSIHRIINLSLKEKYGNVLPFIYNQQAFTTLTLQRGTNATRSDLTYFIKLLYDSEMIKQVGVLPSTSGPKSKVYLVVGGDEARIKDAVVMHNSIKDDAKQRFLNVVEYEDVINDIVIYFKQNYEKGMGYASIYVHDLIRKRMDGETNGDILAEVRRRLAIGGWKVM